MSATGRAHALGGRLHNVLPDLPVRQRATAELPVLSAQSAQAASIARLESVSLGRAASTQTLRPPWPGPPRAHRIFVTRVAARALQSVPQWPTAHRQTSAVHPGSASPSPVKYRVAARRQPPEKVGRAFQAHYRCSLPQRFSRCDAGARLELNKSMAHDGTREKRAEAARRANESSRTKASSGETLALGSIRPTQAARALGSLQCPRGAQRIAEIRSAATGRSGRNQ